MTLRRWGRSVRGRRRPCRVLLVGWLVGVLMLPTAALAVPEWRSSNGGRGWGPCAEVVFTIDRTTIPTGVSETDVRRALSDAAALLNDAAGRRVVRVAGGTTSAGADPADGTNAVLFGGSSRAFTTTGPNNAGDTRIVDADVMLDSSGWVRASEANRRRQLAHELGHALGLAHVADAHEIMSYGFIDDGDGLGPGTSRALRTLYPGTGCSSDPVLTDSHRWDLPGPRPVARRAAVGGSAGDVRALAVDLGTRLALRSGGGTGWASHAVVCRDDVFADCLGGAALAGDRAPLVFAPGGPDGRWSAADATVQFLRSAVPADRPVFVLGGPQAVSDPVFDTLAARWPRTRRLQGPSRFETSAEVARQVVAREGRKGTALLARGDHPADAVAGGAAGARLGLPVLVTPRDELHRATRAALDQLGARRVLVLGGQAALSDAVVSRIGAAGHAAERVAGATRSATAVAISRHGALWDRGSVADGQGFIGLNGWHDEMWALALAAAPLGAATDAPILLTGPEDVAYTPRPGDLGHETGDYLATLTGSGQVTMLYVGAGRWADEHAQRSFQSYLGLR